MGIKVSVLKVIEWPNKVLETRAEEVKSFDQDLKKFVSDMHETMDHAGGIGLAANQVNSLKRVLVICIPFNDDKEEESTEEKKWWHNKRFTFINPTIKLKNGKNTYQEGCLSFPGMYEYVERAKTLTVEAQDENGKTFEVEADGLLAICLQHEIDHLDGIVFTQRMSRVKADMLLKKLSKKRLLEPV